MAEGGGLLNRYTVNSRIVGSNPIPSAIPPFMAVAGRPKKRTETIFTPVFCLPLCPAVSYYLSTDGGTKWGMDSAFPHFDPSGGGGDNGAHRKAFGG